MLTDGISSCTLEKNKPWSYRYVDEIDCTYVSMFMCTGAYVCGYMIMLCLGLRGTRQVVVCTCQWVPWIFMLAFTVLGLQASAKKSGFIFVNLHNDL